MNRLEQIGIELLLHRRRRRSVEAKPQPWTLSINHQAVFAPIPIQNLANSSS
jgi:hypothetical protein